jgi:4-amino-4-deoxy-L-arabinose transferase-like glycosyltransferase
LNVSRRGLFILFVVFALAWFGALGQRPLVKADEGRYGEIPREMVASGDWVTPRLNGFKYFEKPPLQYWATAVGYELFGIGDWQTRLWTALTGFLGVLFTFFTARRLFGAASAPTAALSAAAVLAGSLFYAGASGFVTLDMGVAFFLSAAVFAFVLAQAEGASGAARRGWMLAAWATMALATLSKGLIGFVLPGGALALYILWRWDWRLLARLHLGKGLALFLLLAAPWFVLVSRANPEFAHFFFVQEHFERFLTKMHHRYQPMWYFIPVLALGITPWLPALVASLWRSARERAAPRPAFDPVKFLLVWCAVVFAFFSVSDSKLPAYILPIYPALAALIGRELARASRTLLIAQSVLALAAGLAALGMPLWLPRLVEETYAPEAVAPFGRWLAGGAIALTLAAAVALWGAWRKRATVSLLATAAGGFVYVQAALLGFGTMAPLFSAYHSVAELRGLIDRDAPFYAVNAYDHTLPFYLGRTVTMVVAKDEMETAIDWEPQKWVPSVQAFAELWHRPGKAYAAFDPAEFDALRAKYALEGEVIARGQRYVILHKQQ